jgi:hypothetical protein
MRIDASGNVGIGTSNPGYKLDILAPTNYRSILIGQAEETGTKRMAIAARHYDSSEQPHNLIGIFTDASNNSILQIGGGFGSTGDFNSVTDIELHTGTGTGTQTTGAMKIDSSGNVGIGESGPAYRLHVDGTNVSSGGGLATFCVVDRTAYNGTNPGAGITLRGIYTSGGNTTNFATIQGIKENTSSGNYASALRFTTRAHAGSLTERMRISSSGHVTKINQPYIRCAGNFAGMATSQGSSTDFSNWADQVQRGITRSGATFTVPTAGEYMITYSFYNWMNNTGKGVTHGVFLKKNSTTIQETNNEFDMGDNNYAYYDNNISNTIVLNMAAGDTFKFTSYADVYAGGTHTNMSAYLLG